jgi:hypothetical protein
LGAARGQRSALETCAPCVESVLRRFPLLSMEVWQLPVVDCRKKEAVGS